MKSPGRVPGGARPTARAPAVPSTSYPGSGVAPASADEGGGGGAGGVDHWDHVADGGGAAGGGAGGGGGGGSCASAVVVMPRAHDIDDMTASRRIVRIGWVPRAPRRPMLRITASAG